MLTFGQYKKRLILDYRDDRCRHPHLVIRPPGVPGGQDGPRRNEGQRSYRVGPSIGPPLHLVLAPFHRIPAHAVMRAVPQHLHVMLLPVTQRVRVREPASRLSLCESSRRLNARQTGPRGVVFYEGGPPFRLGEGAGNVGKGMELGVHIGEARVKMGTQGDMGREIWGERRGWRTRIRARLKYVRRPGRGEQVRSPAK